jgi:hypothetical protein
LYWKKHRISPAGGPGSSLSEGLLDSISAAAAVQSKEAALLNMDGNVVTSSSALTYGGGDAIGGNLAKDLRRRRKGKGTWAHWKYVTGGVRGVVCMLTSMLRRPHRLFGMDVAAAEEQSRLVT